MSGKEPNTEQIPTPIQSRQQDAVLYSLLQQLNESQWWSSKQLVRGQLHQLRRVVAYAVLYSPFYRERFRNLDVNRLELENFRMLPILTRRDLQEYNDTIDCSQLPENHGKTSEIMTSGSTATPVKVRGTGLTSMLWNAINMREQLWHQRDHSRIMAAIRWHSDPIGLAPAGIEFEDWGMPINQFYKTGLGFYLNSSADIADQLRWLQKIKPAYLMSHPSNLMALLREAQRQAIKFPELREVRTVGETVTDELRQLAQVEFNAHLVDFYSTQEVGYIAIQCPLNEHYHIQSESVLVEVVREDGSACESNEVGKILVTSLRNYATPLIRYDIGDYGEMGEACSCGRSLPVLRRIHGRVRNMLQLPDGNKRWPNFGFAKFMEIAPLRQFQVVQRRFDLIELKLVVDEKLSAEQEAGIKQVLITRLGHPFAVEITYHEVIARTAGGKYEDFVSMISVN